MTNQDRTIVIYEVHLTINKDIFDEYYHWLVEHIEKMLFIRGFCHAEIAEDTHDKQVKRYTVRYRVSSEEDLNQYFANQATAMREEGLKKFGNQFSATRKISDHA